MRLNILKITTVPISLKLLLKGQFLFLNENGFDVNTISGHGDESEYLIKNQKVKTHSTINLTRKITPFKDLKAIYECYQIIKKLKPVIVHTYTPKAGLIGMIASYLAKTPIKLHNVTGLPLMEATGFKQKILILVEKLTYFFADKVYINSFGILEFVNKNISQSPKIKILGKGSTNGINGEFFNKSPEITIKSEAIFTKLKLSKNDFIWIFIGRIVKDKGINELLSSFDKISQNKPMKLLLIGDFENDLDPISSDSKKIIFKNHNILSLGFQNDIRPYLQISNCLVFPSYREGLPNVPMQASCFDLPIIATNINGCNEIVENGINGLLVPAKSTEGLLNAMEKMYNDATLREKCSEVTREMTLSKFDQKVVWNNLLNEYKKLLNDVQTIV